MKAGITASLLGALASRVSGLIVILILARGLGLELFGFYAVTAVLIASQSVLDLGAASSLICYGAMAVERHDRLAFVRLFWQCMWVYVAVSAVFTIVILTVGRGAVVELIDPSPGARAGAMTLVTWSPLAFALSNFAVVALAALQAAQRFVLAASINVLSSLGALVVVLAVGMNLGWIAAAVAYPLVVSAAQLAMASVVLTRLLHAFPGVPGLHRQPSLRAVMGFGLRAQYINVADLVVFQFPRLVLGSLAGGVAAGAFDLSLRLPQLFSTLFAASTAPLLPHSAAHAEAGLDRLRLQHTWSEANRLLGSAAAFFLGGTVVVGPAALVHLTGVSISAVEVPVAILSLGLLCHILTGPSTTIALGAWGLALPVRYKTTVLLLTLTTGVPLVVRFGVPGAATGIAFSTGIGLFVVLRGFATRAGVPLAAGARPLVAAVVSASFAAAAGIFVRAALEQSGNGVIALLGSGATYVVVALVGLVATGLLGKDLISFHPRPRTRAKELT